MLNNVLATQKIKTNQSFIAKSILISMTALALVGCGDNNDSTSDTSSANNQAKSTISFKPKNMENLGDKYDYEGWLITPSGAIATGKFDIDNQDKEKEQKFVVNKKDADAATTFVLTIEPQNETGKDAEKPTNVHIIGGDIRNNTSILTTSHSTALKTDFSSAKAKYILATPTNGNATPTQGIWFIDESTGSAKAGLELPSLPSGWKYEGWIVGENGPMTTGTFLKGNEKDSDGAGKAAGTKGSPAFPGQDYVNPAMDLLGKTAVISVEPDPDNSTAPFSIKPLVGKITNENGKMMLENKAAGNLPTATISITAN